MIETKAGQVYSALGAPEKFKSVLYPETGHTYTPHSHKTEWSNPDHPAQDITNTSNR
jgi:hypothetical protein